MKDSITAGFVCGVFGAIVMNLLDWMVSSVYNQKEYLYSWASVVIYGRLPKNTWEIVFSQIGQILFAGILGIIFCSLLANYSRGNYLIRGWLYGVGVWFFTYAISIIVRLPFLTTHSAVTITSHFASASLYGLTLAIAVNRIFITKQL